MLTSLLANKTGTPTDLEHTKLADAQSGHWCLTKILLKSAFSFGGRVIVGIVVIEISSSARPQHM